MNQVGGLVRPSGYGLKVTAAGERHNTLVQPFRVNSLGIGE